ncbi:MAG TPA: PAS domain-containing protein [Vicinamibacterales bacterium]|nr:PAS domain-containing protein [Vicinamibacterales bacterium]
MRTDDLSRQIVESIGDCVKILTLDGRIQYINNVGLRMLELPAAEALLDRPLAGFFEGDVRKAAESAVEEARANRHGRFQYEMRTSSGVVKWFDAVVTPMTGESGAISHLLAISRDITARRRDEAFRDSQHEVLEMIATGSSLAAVLDRLVLMVEQRTDGMLCTVLLLDEDGTTARHGAAPSLPAAYMRAIDGLPIGPTAGSCGTAMHFGRRIIVTDIETDPLWAQYREVALGFGLRACWSTPIFSPQRKVLGSFAMYYDQPRSPTDAEIRLIEHGANIARIAIEHQRASQAVRQSEARTQAILRAIPDWMFVMSADGVFLDCHARDTSKLVVPPAAFLGRNIRDVLPPSVAEPLAQAFMRVCGTDNEAKVEYTLGSEADERIYEASIVSCDHDRVLSIVRDMTDRKRAELDADANRRELAHLSRVAMLGEMSGTLAHELSQPLAAVLSNAQAARLMLDHAAPDLEQLRLTLDDIIRNDRRAGAVIDRLRALLRKGDIALQPIDPNDVVKDVIDLAYGELTSRRVAVRSDLSSGLPLVLGDRVQLQQVVLNLLLNGCDAMNATPASDRQLTFSTATHDGSVEIAVSDRGSGIPSDQLERVFEPFVTFREQGLGLGLAISRSIVTAHGGSIRAENNADGGATFRCQLPVAQRG